VTPSVIIIPVLNCPDLAERAIWSALQQSVAPLHVLVIDQASTEPTQEMINRVRGRWLQTPEGGPQLHVWRHAPALPSLAATWNTGLDFAWDLGAEDALVINHDVELPQHYYQALQQRLQQDDLLFLSGVGVGNHSQVLWGSSLSLAGEPMQYHPDFSAYLIHRECHRHQRFDEEFIPAYCEDWDYHRRLLLDSLGFLIGKINVPFLHHSSGVLKSLEPKQQRKLEDQIGAGSRAYYTKKWGGPGGQETKLQPFGPDVSFPVTLDTLRDLVIAGIPVAGHILENLRGTSGRSEPEAAAGPVAG
jgi:glycosyltransferase involved in cell wall biosynthesis